MTKESLEPPGWQSYSIGSSGTRASRNQERTRWPSSPDSGRTQCGQWWQCPEHRRGHSKSSVGSFSVGGKDVLPKQLPKSVRGQAVLSPSQAQLCTWLCQVCVGGRERDGRRNKHGLSPPQACHHRCHRTPGEDPARSEAFQRRENKSL